LNTGHIASSPSSPSCPWFAVGTSCYQCAPFAFLKPKNRKPELSGSETRREIKKKGFVCRCILKFTTQGGRIRHMKVPITGATSFFRAHIPSLDGDSQSSFRHIGSCADNPTEPPPSLPRATPMSSSSPFAPASPPFTQPDLPHLFRHPQYANTFHPSHRPAVVHISSSPYLSPVLFRL